MKKLLILALMLIVGVGYAQQGPSIRLDGDLQKYSIPVGNEPRSLTDSGVTISNKVLTVDTLTVTNILNMPGPLITQDIVGRNINATNQLQLNGVDVATTNQLVYKNINWCLGGDSTTHEYTNNTYSILLKRTLPTVTFTNIAVSGNVITQQIATLTALTGFTSTNAYNIYSCMISVNDVAKGDSVPTICSNYISLVTLAKTKGFNAVGVAGMYGFSTYTNSIDAVNTFMKSYCETNGIAWIDVPTAFNIPNTITANTNYIIYTAGNYHENEEGYSVIFKEMLKAFNKGFAPVSSDWDKTKTASLIAAQGFTPVSKTVRHGREMYLSGTTIAVPPNASGGQNVGWKFSSSGNSMVNTIPYATTNMILNCQFGSIGTATNFGVRLAIVAWCYNPDGLSRSNAGLYSNNGLNATNSYDISGTQKVFVVSFPVSTNISMYAGAQYIINTYGTDVSATVNFATNGFYIDGITSQILIGY